MTMIPKANSSSQQWLFQGLVWCSVYGVQCTDANSFADLFLLFAVVHLAAALKINSKIKTSKDKPTPIPNSKKWRKRYMYKNNALIILSKN